MIGTAQVSYIHSSRFSVAVNRHISSRARSGAPFGYGTVVASGAEKVENRAGVSIGAGIRIDAKCQCILLAANGTENSDVILHAACNRLVRTAGHHPGSGNATYNSP